MRRHCGQSPAGKLSGDLFYTFAVPSDPDRKERGDREAIVQAFDKAIVAMKANGTHASIPGGYGISQ